MGINRIIYGLLITCCVFYPTEVGNPEYIKDINTYTNISISEETRIMYNQVYKIHEELIEEINTVHEEPIEDINKLTNDEIDLISRVVMAEAEDEPLEGKIYVVDTIFNRVDSNHFPNTVYKVIYQPSQFSSMWNGRYDRCNINSELTELVKEEYKNRKNNDIVFFTADHYGDYGNQSFRVGNHYFSTFNEEELK